jgi:predicted RNA-binding protein with PUA-like domain
MPAWILKTEPEEFSWADLVRLQRASWDGVRNPQAIGFMKQMQPGDEAFIYHTGREKAVVGLAQVVSFPRPDPGGVGVIVDVSPVRPLAAVTLARLREIARPGFLILRQPRLSVAPVPQTLHDLLISASIA